MKNVLSLFYKTPTNRNQQLRINPGMSWLLVPALFKTVYAETRSVLVGNSIYIFNLFSNNTSGNDGLVKEFFNTYVRDLVNGYCNFNLTEITGSIANQTKIWGVKVCNSTLSLARSANSTAIKPFEDCSENFASATDYSFNEQCTAPSEKSPITPLIYLSAIIGAIVLLTLLVCVATKMERCHRDEVEDENKRILEPA